MVVTDNWVRLDPALRLSDRDIPCSRESGPYTRTTRAQDIDYVPMWPPFGAKPSGRFLNTEPVRGPSTSIHILILQL